MDDSSTSEPVACPVETGLELLSGRWKARILWKLYNRTMRFGELRRELPGITDKMLTQQLRELERHQLVVRTQYPEVPPRVEYSLSQFGASLTPVLEALKEWGNLNQTRILQVRNLSRDGAVAGAARS